MLAALHLPYFHLGSLDIGIPIQSFGMIVAAGVLIGAALLRRYAEWHGVSDEHIRGLTGWITVSGFIGAHVFDVIAYQWHDLMEDPKLFFEIWKGISSYGGFIGGAIGFAIYVWWKRLPARLMADTAIVGLLPAFSIGRIGCTVVSDHIGAVVDRGAWYAGLAMNYPADLSHPERSLQPIAELMKDHRDMVVDSHLLAWNLGLVEFLYLIPVNALILFLAFKSWKRVNAGIAIVLSGLLYAPVRFFLDFLRPEETDPRYIGLTFAQWASFLAFGAAAYVAFHIFQKGAPAEVVTKTSGEAQAKLKMILKEDVEPKKELEPEELPSAKATVKAKGKGSAEKSDEKSEAKSDESEAKSEDAKSDESDKKSDDPASKSTVKGKKK